MADLTFNNDSTAASAAITNNGSIVFNDSSTAGTATITINDGANLQFVGTSTAGTAVIVNNLGGLVDFSDTSGTLGDNKVSAGSIEGAGDFRLGPVELTVGSNNSSTEVSGVISGIGGSLVKTGSGTLTLTGANTYDGGTTISQGTLELGDVSNTATIVGTVLNNSTLNVVNANLNGTTGITNNATMSFQSNSTAGSAAITNNSSIAFTGNSTAGSATIVNNLGGTVDFSNTSGALGDNKVSAGSIAGAGNFSLGANELTVGSNNTSTTVSGTIDGVGGSLVKTGGGTLTLTGTNTYTGGTTISTGTLELGDTSNTATIVGTVLNNATLNVVNANIDTTTVTNSGTLNFQSNSTAGSATTTNNGDLFFLASSAAGTATISNSNSIQFQATSTAASAAITNDGVITFRDNSTAGSATIINNSSANVGFNSDSTAGSANITNNGNWGFTDSSTAGNATIANSGDLSFSENSTADTSVITNDGGINFTGNSTAGSATIVNNLGGTVDFSNTSGALGDNKVSAGSIAGAGNYQLGANELTVGSNNTSTEVSGVISGLGGSLVKTGTGTMILSGDNTYDGGTTISQGTLQIGNGGSTGSIVGNIVNDGELWITRTGTLTLAGDISGSGSIGINQAGSTVILSGTNSYNGGTLINGNGATVQVTNSSSVGTGFVILDGGIFEAGADALNFSNVFGIGGAGGTVNVGSNTLTLSGGINDTENVGTLTKNGSGTLVLSGTGSFSGQLTLTTGTLRFESSSAIGTANILTGSATIDYASGIDIANTIELDGQVLQLQVTGGTATQSGAITEQAGGHGVEKTGAGTLTLTGENSYDGGTTITSGTLQIGDGGTTGSIAGDIVNNSALVINRSDTYTLDGAISGTGTVTKAGDGTLTLSGVNSYDGGTFIDQGTVEVTNNSSVGTGTVTMQDETTFRAAASGLNFGNAFALEGFGTIDTSSFVMTLTGIISGTGRMTKAGSGTLILTNTNVYTGGTDIEGTLQLGNGGTTGSITGNVVNNGILAVNRSNTYTISGDITGNGAFEQNGTGTTILTGTSFYGGSTTVNAGTLQVDGALSFTSGVTVNSGATLSGSGNVTDTVINTGGTLMPGDGSAPATFTVTGNLTFNGGSTYVVFMTPTLNSLTNVSGVATLSGTVNVTATPGVYNAGQQYNILTATGGFNGTTFTDLTTTGFGSNVPTLGYDADDVFLTFGTDQVVLLPSFTGNRGNVASGINNAMLGGATPPPGFNALFALTGPQLSNGLSQISGEASGGATQAGIQMSNHFLSLMLNPFSGAPDGNWGTMGFARGFGAGEKELSPEAAAAYAAVTPKDKRADTFGARWSFWGGGFGGYNSINGDASAGTHDTNTRTYGFAAGADYRPGADSVVGFAMSGGGTTWSLADSMGSGRSDVFQIGVYGAKQFGPAYVSAAASYGWHDASTDRTITVSGTDHLAANFNVHNFGGRLETGYRFITPFAGITPYASVQVQNFSSPGYSEYAVSGSNTFALSYGSRSNTATRTELGAWFDKLFALDGGNSLLIRTRAAWVHDHYSDPSMGAAFQTLPGSSFTVDAAAAPPDSALLSAGAELRLRNGWSIRAKFDGEFAGTGQTYAGTGTVRYAW